MDPVVASLAGTLIGAVAGIAGGWLSGSRQAALEREKWLRERSEEFSKELRSSVKELTTTLADAMHAMGWLCWRAKHDSGRLGQADIDEYDDAMHRLLPRIFGLHAVIAGMDEDVHRRLGSLVTGAVRLDVRVGQASLEFKPGVPDSAAPMAELFGSANDLLNALHEGVADSIRRYAVTPVSRGSQASGTTETPT
jgi:hypothetical protein